MNGPIKWCFVILILSIHIRTFVNQQMDEFLVATYSRTKQRSHVIFILHIHISTFADKKFSDFFVIFSSRIMQWSLSKNTLHIHIRRSG